MRQEYEKQQVPVILKRRHYCYPPISVVYGAYHGKWNVVAYMPAAVCLPGEQPAILVWAGDKGVQPDGEDLRLLNNATHLVVFAIGYFEDERNVFFDLADDFIVGHAGDNHSCLL